MCGAGKTEEETRRNFQEALASHFDAIREAPTDPGTGGQWITWKFYRATDTPRAAAFRFDVRSRPRGYNAAANEVQFPICPFLQT